MRDGDLARLAQSAALLGLLGRVTSPLFASARGVLLVQLGIGASGVAQTLAALRLGAARQRPTRRVRPGGAGLRHAVVPAS